MKLLEVVGFGTVRSECSSPTSFTYAHVDNGYRRFRTNRRLLHTSSRSSVSGLRCGIRAAWLWSGVASTPRYELRRAFLAYTYRMQGR